MSTFNTKETIMAGGKNLNFDRHLYRLSPEWELYTAVVNTLGLSGTFYESGNERQRRIRDLVRKCDHRFTAKLAVYARRQMNLRTVPLILLVELADIHRGDSLVSKAVEKCIMRADEIGELLACYQWRNKKSNLKGMSAQLLRGLRAAFNRFDEYQFAKYSLDCSSNDKEKMVTLRDALFLVHPKAKDERQQEIFDRIAREELTPPYTWEHEKTKIILRHYDSYKEKLDAERDMWEAMIDSGRLGYMALIRNLVRMYTLGISVKAVESLCKQITDAEALRKSHMMPFRLFTAWKELRNLENQSSGPLIIGIGMGVIQELHGNAEKTLRDIQTCYKYDRYYWDCYQGWRKVWLKNLHGAALENAWKKYYYNREKYLKNLRTCLDSEYKKAIWIDTHYTINRKVVYRFDKSMTSYQSKCFRLLEEMRGNKPDNRSTYTHHVRRKRIVCLPKTRKMKVVRKSIKDHRRLFREYNKNYELLSRWIGHWLPCKMLMDALNQATEQATESIKGFSKDTRVLIACGMTHAMRDRTISKGSKVTLMDIAAFLAVSLAWRCDNVLLGRLTTKFTPYPLHRGERSCDDSLSLNWQLSSNQEPLNALGVLKWMTRKRDVEDKVIIFTDGQLLFGDMFTQQWKKYKRLVNPDAKLYIFDLAGNGTTPVKPGTDDVYTIAGWNDAVFDILEKLELGSNALKEIRDIKL